MGLITCIYCSFTICIFINRIMAYLGMAGVSRHSPFGHIPLNIITGGPHLIWFHLVWFLGLPMNPMANTIDILVYRHINWNL